MKDLEILIDLDGYWYIYVLSKRSILNMFESVLKY